MPLKEKQIDYSRGDFGTILARVGDYRDQPHGTFPTGELRGRTCKERREVSGGDTSV